MDCSVSHTVVGPIAWGLAASVGLVNWLVGPLGPSDGPIGLQSESCMRPWQS
jgi:hypothetical protein